MMKSKYKTTRKVRRLRREASYLHFHNRLGGLSRVKRAARQAKKENRKTKTVSTTPVPEAQPKLQ